MLFISEEMTSFIFPSALRFCWAPCLLNPISMLLAAEDAQSGNAILETDIERLSIHYRQAYRGNVSATELPQAISVLDEQLIKMQG